MINVTIFRDSSDEYRGVSLVGHAGYAEYGQDIICAAASILSTNLVNSIEKLTKDKISYNVDEDTGFLSMSFCGKQISNESKLLVDSFILGIDSIRESYGDTYIKISYKEV
ncbi:MAG: ribosomal-processing cysteine protease Prp [Lachnospiraceae bacterium]|nr:ribosomal-processing cysteine protease Prp [Lachnospiraceae bacterium]